MSKWNWKNWPWNTTIRTVRSVSAPGVWTRRINNLKSAAVPIAVVAGGVWGFWVYVNPDSLRPRDYQAHLAVQAKAELIHVFPDRAVINLNMSVANKSKTMIRTTGAFFEVFGYYADRPSKQEETLILQELLSSMNNDEDERTPIHFYPRENNDAKRISAGRIMPDQMVLESGEEYEYSIVTSVPCTIDVIQVTVNLFYHKTRLKQGNRFEVIWESVGDQLWASHTADGEKVEAGTQGINWSDMVREMVIPRNAAAGDPITNECVVTKGQD